MATSATTITTTETTNKFVRETLALEKHLDEIDDQICYTNTSVVGIQEQTYNDHSLALSQIDLLNHSIRMAIEQITNARMALANLGVNAGIEPDDYADDSLRTY
jgi:low affinity Fe/Cu permease